MTASADLWVLKCGRDEKSDLPQSLILVAAGLLAADDRVGQQRAHPDRPDEESDQTRGGILPDDDGHRLLHRRHENKGRS